MGWPFVEGDRQGPDEDTRVPSEVQASLLVAATQCVTIFKP